jgi:hypothetical protein
MNNDPLLVRCLLACYPAQWRRHYAAEYAALLSDALLPAPWFRRVLLIADVLRGALDARLNPRGYAMTDRVRTPMTTAAWAAALFTVAGIGFRKMTEDPPLNGPGGQPAAVGWSFTLLVVGAALALLALIVAALPTAMAMIRGQGKGSFKFLAVPPLALAVWFGLLSLVFRIAGNAGVHSARNVMGFSLVIVSGLGVLAATAWAACAVFRRVAAPTPPRWRAVTLTVVAAGMAATTVACLAWGLALRAATPGGFTAYSQDGLLATPLLPSWIVQLVLMAAATALAVQASRRELTANAA